MCGTVDNFKRFLLIISKKNSFKSINLNDISLVFRCSAMSPATAEMAMHEAISDRVCEWKYLPYIDKALVFPVPT